MTYKEIKHLFKGYDAYLVGGAARSQLEYFEDNSCFNEELEKVKDWDVLVDNQVPPLLSGKRRLNSFGGIKYTQLNIDVWQDNIGRYLRKVPRGKDGVAIHLETGTILITHEFINKPDKDIEDRQVRKRDNAEHRETS